MSPTPSALGTSTATPPSGADDAWAPAEPPYATWVSRVLAALIDIVVVTGTAVFIVGIIFISVRDRTADSFSGNIGWKDLTGSDWPAALTAFLTVLAVRILNEGVLQGRVGQSIGKRFLRIAVVDATSPTMFLGPGRGMMRVLVDQLLAFPAQVTGSFGLITMANYVWPWWDLRNQTWTDKAVKSVVVSIR